VTARWTHVVDIAEMVVLLRATLSNIWQNITKEIGARRTSQLVSAPATMDIRALRCGAHLSAKTESSQC
jgi:hypothetical protein